MVRPRQGEARQRRRVEVRYAAVHDGEADTHSSIGFSGNLSRQGMMIRTPRVLPPGTLLKIELRYAQRSLTLTGRVVWAREGPVQWLASGKVGMGIRFVDPPAGIDDFVKGATSAPTGEPASRKA